eukprot:m.239541 g.239541  ORF g.239541 m.239541 type:complete len:985 (-) comp13496_c0_seq1:374-3328(-)
MASHGDDVSDVPRSSPQQDSGRRTSADLVQVILWALDYESLYHDNLRLLLENFMSPLRQWSIIKLSEQAQIFGNAEELYTASTAMIQSLKTIATSKDRIDAIAGLFTSDLLAFYRSYCDNYPLADKTLAKCLQKQERFEAFVTVQQRNTTTTLERLIRQPVDRVSAYYEIVRKVLACTPDTHARRGHLEENLHNWGQLLRSLEEARRIRDNEEKLAAIELSFPDDDLQLLVRPGSPTGDGAGSGDKGDKLLRASTVRRLSAPSALFKFVSMKDMGKRFPRGVRMHNSAIGAAAMAQQGEEQLRTFIREGPALLVEEDHTTRRRYLFLFSDLLCVAKPRTRGTYSLKLRIPLRSAWMLPQAVTPKGDDCFGIGTPLCKFSAFATPDHVAWVDAIEKGIAGARASGLMHGHINIMPMLTDVPAEGAEIEVETLEVSMTDTAQTVVAGMMTRLNLPIDARSYLIWEISRAGLQPVQSWEPPLVIVQYGVSVGNIDDACHFIMRQTSAPDLTVEMLPLSLRRIIKDRSPRMPHKQLSAGPSVSAPAGKPKSRPTSSREVSMVRDTASPLGTPEPPMGSGGALFGQPLAVLVVNGELPGPVKDMLARLTSEGPSAIGLFRKSANARVIKQMRERLDNGLPVDLSSVPVLAVGAILKEFLRSLPVSVFPVDLYYDFITLNDIEDPVTRLEATRQKLLLLPEAHLILLQAILPVLVVIADNHAENNMNAANLAICVGQSLMWPPSAEEVLKNDVPPFIEYLINNTHSLFGDPDGLPESSFESAPHTPAPAAPPHSAPRSIWTAALSTPAPSPPNSPRGTPPVSPYSAKRRIGRQESGLLQPPVAGTPTSPGTASIALIVSGASAASAASIASAASTASLASASSSTSGLDRLVLERPATRTPTIATPIPIIAEPISASASPVPDISITGMPPRHRRASQHTIQPPSFERIKIDAETPHTSTPPPPYTPPSCPATTVKIAAIDCDELLSTLV